jgi:predicted transcriptional regulator
MEWMNPDKIGMLQKKIAAFRKRKYKIGELAEGAEVHRSSIYRLEQGKRISKQNATRIEIFLTENNF